MRTLLLVCGLAACGPPRPADIPRMPPTPEVRIAIAPLHYARWNGEAEKIDVRLQVRDWLANWHGVTTVPHAEVDPIVAKQLTEGATELRAISTFGQTDAEGQAQVAAACRAARELQVDALIYGRVHYDELASHKCVRETGIFDKSPQCAEYGGLESMRTEASLHLVVVHAASCGFNELDLDGLGRSADPDRSYYDAWQLLRVLTRKHVPDAVREPPRNPPPQDPQPAV